MLAPLERGKACSRCRRRKMRCDGERPGCSQCIRNGTSDDCEYLDGPGPTQNQLLESEIVRLESRIAELTASSAPLTLHDPYAAWHEAQRHAQQSSSDHKRALVRVFVRHATEFGFFLHIHSFLDRVFAQSPQAGRHHSLNILLDIICLLGARLSGNPQIQALEPTYLDRALQNLPNARPEEPGSALNVLQAEVLLANYFFTSNRQLEGAYHMNAAVAIAIAAKLHVIRSARTQRAAGEHTPYHVAPPRDLLEEGERINGFWTVFILDRCWAIASGYSPGFTDDESAGTQIDTPWPMELAHYQTYPFPSDFRSSRTVQSFIAGMENTTHAGNLSILAMHAQAAILYEGATRLASRYSPSSQASFVSLENRIERFKQTLPRFERIDAARGDFVRAVLLMHTLAHCASIQLHTPLVQHRGITANSRTYQAAHAAVMTLRNVNPGTLGCVNPFMGILWTSVAKVIAQTRRHSAAGVAGPSPQLQQPGGGLQDERILQAELERVLAAMEQNAGFSPLMNAQVSAFRSPRSSGSSQSQ